MKTKRNYQNKLAANRYTTLNDDGEDNYSTHTPQYEEREDMYRRMEENGKQPNITHQMEVRPFGIHQRWVNT